MNRIDGRTPDQIRDVVLHTDYLLHAEGSTLIELGNTRVLCAVSVEERVPGFLRGTGAGWVTAEYSMLPRSTDTRTVRERERVSGRTHEIQRLIGRSLRAVTNLDLLGERTFTVDCDVIQADGGTRTAAITGAYVALYLAMHRLVQQKVYAQVPLSTGVAATSIGIMGNEVLVDLCYAEDSQAEVDFNVVKTALGEYVEVQGTAEGRPFGRPQVDRMLDRADDGFAVLFAAQERAIQEAVAQAADKQR